MLGFPASLPWLAVIVNRGVVFVNLGVFNDDGRWLVERNVCTVLSYCTRQGGVLEKLGPSADCRYFLEVMYYCLYQK